MDTMNLIVAKNMKHLREQNKLSMDELAKLSGVSKSMLAQIERGAGNPTVSTLWKLANGMKIPFEALTVQPKTSYEIVKTSEIQPFFKDGDRVKVYSLFPDNENRRFTIYYLELEPGSYWQSESHISKGESIRFRGDYIHSYRNISREMAILHMTLYNP